MDANDLRIGNLVYLPSKTFYTVDILYKNYSMLKYWNPIEITNELLLKTDSEFEIKLTEQGVCFFGNLYYGIKYIHQLQNLYFALVQRELNFIL